MILVVALVIGGDAGPSDLLLGAAAGIAGALGLVSLFAGLSQGNAAAVAPTAAAVAAVLPVIVAVVDGERPSALAWVGVAIAVPAIVLSSWVADPGETPGADSGTGWPPGSGSAVSPRSSGSPIPSRICSHSSLLGPRRCWRSWCSPASESGSSSGLPVPRRGPGECRPRRERQRRPAACRAGRLWPWPPSPPPSTLRSRCSWPGG